MRDRNQEYPVHQPGRGQSSHHDPFAPTVQGEGELEDQPKQHAVHQREEASMPQLPRGHATKALIGGLILGGLVSLQGVILTYKNADLYREAAKYTMTTMPTSLALSIFWIFLLGLGISLVIYLLGGLIIGKIAVRRRWAFIGGFVGGVFSSLIGAGLKYIPGYPNGGTGSGVTSPLGVGQGLVALIIGVIVLGVVAGLVTLLGSWVVTRRHPYYVGYSG
jgi:hypothetical protein